MAGGDSGSKLEGVLELSTSTVSSATAQIYNTSTNTFEAVHPLNTPRESAAAVVLPNGLTLIVGGENCQSSEFSGATSGAFLCTALQTAELFNENTNTFSYAGSGSGGLMTIARSGPTATLIEGSGTSLDGQVLIVGGSTGLSFLSATTQVGAPLQTALNTAELYNPATDAFTPISATLPGCPAGETATTTPACTTAVASNCAAPTPESPITSASESSTTVTVTMLTANPTGLTVGSSVTVAGMSVGGYNGVFIVTAIPSSTTFQYTASSSGLAAATGGFASAGNIVSASESGSTVTVTTTANVPGLIVGDYVTISSVKEGSSLSSNDYDGEYLVTGPGTTGQTVTGDTFTYTASGAGLTAGTGGFATADTFECGILDQGAATIPNDGGQVLLAGGDSVTFLGVSSNYSFLFNPNGETFTKTAGNLNTPREENSLVAMDPAVVTGALSGYLVTFGGIESNSANCPANSGELVATTLDTAEVYDPSTQTWSFAANDMGTDRAAQATLIETGPDAGEVILPGGVNVEVGTYPSTCAAVTSLKQTATTETDLYAPDTGTGGTFSATGSLNQAREGTAQGVLIAGTHEGDILVAGGACTNGTLESAPIGTSEAETLCGSTSAENDYSELYSQSGTTWTVGPSYASGFTPANESAFVVLP
jgi:Kelch motif